MAITPTKGRLEAGAPTGVFAKLRIAVKVLCVVKIPPIITKRPRRVCKPGVFGLGRAWESAPTARAGLRLTEAQPPPPQPAARASSPDPG